MWPFSLRVGDPSSEWLLSDGHSVVLNLEDHADIALCLDLAQRGPAYGAKSGLT